MTYNASNPLILQSDKTVLLEVDNPLYEEARDALARFAELEKSPEHVHTYRITPLSLWNAAGAATTVDDILGSLDELSKYALAQHVAADIRDHLDRYWRLRLRRHDRGPVLPG